MLSSEAIKEKAFRYGADICGVAPVARFADAPAGFHPRDIYPGCESVLVFGSRFPTSTLEAQTNCPYTFVRNRMVDKLDGISFRLSSDLESEGVVAMPIPSAEPRNVNSARESTSGNTSATIVSGTMSLSVRWPFAAT